MQSLLKSNGLLSSKQLLWKTRYNS